MLPRAELLLGTHDRAGLERLLDQAEAVLRTWQPQWSLFLDAPLQEEAFDRFSSLTELSWRRDGGYPGAERCRLLCKRRDPDLDPGSEDQEPAPIVGLAVEGNFLFDPIVPADIRRALAPLGAEPEQLGDVWIRGDRGAQLLCTPEVADRLNGQQGRLRDVQIHCETMLIDGLQLPVRRAIKRFSSVEASCRLDAIASAGFGLSRSKVSQEIRLGHLRLNWEPIRQASRELKVGDRLHLQNRGSVEVLSLTLTKRERWRVEMERR
jgi:photosystem II S4 domain protein